jgi:hypothetical protein
MHSAGRDGHAPPRALLEQSGSGASEPLHPTTRSRTGRPGGPKGSRFPTADQWRSVPRDLRTGIVGETAPAGYERKSRDSGDRRRLGQDPCSAHTGAWPRASGTAVCSSQLSKDQRTRLGIRQGRGAARARRRAVCGRDRAGRSDPPAHASSGTRTPFDVHGGHVSVLERSSHKSAVRVDDRGVVAAGGRSSRQFRQRRVANDRLASLVVFKFIAQRFDGVPLRRASECN